MDPLLRQFIGRRIGAILYKDMENTINYWMNQTILPLDYGIDGYRVTIADIQTDELARQNKVRVLVEVRYNRALDRFEAIKFNRIAGRQYLR